MMKDYQKLAHSTAIYPEGDTSFALARKLILSFCSIAADCEQLKKYYRDGKSLPPRLLNTEDDVQVSLKLLYPLLGLIGEIGELTLKIDTKNTLGLRKEFGDVFWYLAELLTQLGFDMEEILAENIEKLSSRKEKGHIQGDGDNR